MLAELYVPEVEADLQEKQAAVVQAQAKKAQAEAAVKVAQAAVASADARVTEVQAGVKRAEAELTRWQQEYRRIEQLFNERAQTGTLLDETRSKLHSAEASADEVRAKVKSADAALTEARAELDKARSDVVAAAASIDVATAWVRHAEAMLGYSRIEAPYDGIITRRNVDTGQLTRPGSDAPPLFIAARTDVVTIVIDLPEMYSTEVNPGDAALVKLQAMKGRTVAGKVTRTAWALDPKTRHHPHRDRHPQPGRQTSPGPLRVRHCHRRGAQGRDDDPDDCDHPGEGQGVLCASSWTARPFASRSRLVSPMAPSPRWSPAWTGASSSSRQTPPR